MPDSTQTAYNCLSQSEAPPIDLGYLLDQLATLETYLRPRAQTNHQYSLIGQLAYLRQHVAAFSPEPPPRRKPKHYHGSEWQRIRIMVLARDGAACTGCGCAYLNQLEIHHIKPISEGGTDDLDNLKTLCDKCHDKTHGILAA